MKDQECEQVPGYVLEGLVAGEGDVVESEAEVRPAPRQPLPHQRDVLNGAVTREGEFRHQCTAKRWDRSCVIPLSGA